MKKRTVKLGSLKRGQRWRMADGRKEGIVGEVIEPLSGWAVGVGVMLEKNGLPNNEVRRSRREVVYWSEYVMVEPL